ncbi:dihydrolipoyl dehydrogenase [Pseudomonas sp. FSL R10-1350]|uniref:dihydrolipoyl dehydrogenase n=1 Tax=Pseudomonas sp. FSL R10-1350 TaxID=2662197 RepID=UPI00129695CF|nr:dihydrolipoyl dehydrogenase [Pseudomonas sp. FSL R10-1350]MQU66261.1 dihydrolipoyl dehydrogenase [Pseudomonas sp. FSL R10-1350]
MSDNTFDVIVVGGGPGGYVAAIRASQLGLRTALVEKAHLGGICLNWGCIPTKALLRSADVLRLIRNAKGFGIDVGQAKPDLEAIVKRSRDVAAQLQRGVSGLMKKHRVQVFNGHGRLNGPQRLSVTGEQGEQQLSAAHIILATGARARVLPGMEPDGQHFWTYREALVPKSIPKRLVIIGGGAIGIEFASFYHALGAHVSVVEMAERILPVEDQDISAHVAQSLTREGINLYTGCAVKSSRVQQGSVQVQLQGKRQETLQADVVLVAAGIVGNVEDLGLEGTGVKVERSHVQVDEYCRTDEPGVYAIGDLAGAPWLAHKASHEAVICVEKIAGHAPHPLNPLSVPACTYSHPQVASVGYTEAQARAAGKALNVGKFPFVANGKAIAMGATEGFVKVIFDADSGELLGAHMVGEEVTEMIQGYVIARGLETTEAELIDSILPHPTMSEAMHEAVLAAYERALHS